MDGATPWPTGRQRQREQAEQERRARKQLRRTGLRRVVGAAALLSAVGLTVASGAPAALWHAAPVTHPEPAAAVQALPTPDPAPAPTPVTVATHRVVHASIPSIQEGAVVGVAAPVEIRFDRHLDADERARAERALRVESTPEVAGSWAWLADDGRSSRAHWRPQEYWPAGTTVRVTAALAGLPLGDAGFGAADLVRTFSIGRAQIVKADVRSHRMVVVRDGQVVTDLPASYGLDSDPRRVTRNGVHVVMSKSETVFMTNPTFGYANVEMHWAVRISNNGEFVHANPASTAAQGNRNVTHGCINLTTANAKAYFETALFGDPVEVTGSPVPLTRQDGDIYDWAIPWEQWRAMSALATQS